MSFVLEAIRDKPIMLHPLNGPGPYTDYSGYGRSIVVVGTPGSHPGLCAGCSRAPVVGNSGRIDFATPVLQQGRESQSFSLGVWVHPLVNHPTERRVLGTTGALSGITITGTKVAFVTKYLTAPEARVEYDLQQIRAVYVVGVHTSDKNSLFINGVLVAETSLTEEQQADLFASTVDWLYAGVNEVGVGFALGAVGVYATALTKESINRHYMLGRLVPEPDAVVESNSGDVIAVSINGADVFLDQWWSTAQDWQGGSLVNTVVNDDRLVPTFEVDTSVAGTWIDTVPLTAANTISMYGASLNWDGEGATVEVSLDGTTWETVQRGIKVTTIPAGFDPTDKVLLVRVSFPGGIVNDTSYMDNLNVVCMRSNSVSAMNGRSVTFANATPEREYPTLDFHDNWGVEIGTGGSVVISADTSTDPVPLRTLELWIKRTGATAPTVSVSGTNYVNGTAGSTLTQGQWSLMHIALAADDTGPITITGPAQVGQVGFYDYALTADQAAKVYAEYFGANPLVVRDTSTINVQESAGTVKIYAYDWTITGSG